MRFIKEKSNKKLLISVGISILAVFLVLFVYTGRDFGNQSKNAMYPSVEFHGLVKIADNDWKPYVKGEHIPSNKGDVTLKGHFELVAPDTGESLGMPSAGTPIAFYFNHIGGEVSEDGVKMYPFDAELDIAGEDMCGVMYTGYEYMGGEEITIILNNPHKFGNARAVDEFLGSLSVYGGTDFERDMLSQGNGQRNWGVILILFAFMILGTAIFSMLIHMKEGRNLWLIGFVVLFAGLYFIFSARGVIFFSEIIKFNTRMIGASMMLYMFSITILSAIRLTGKPKKIGGILILISLISNIICFAIPVFTNIKFYDTLPLWVSVQSVICIVMTVLLANKFSVSEKSGEILCALGMLPMIAFLLDVIGTFFGWWQGGLVSGIVFIFLFIIALILFLSVIPKNLNSAIKAREWEAEKTILKAELTESRIATMISQIQPHFIYNTLGTIEQLCMNEPEMAAKLVRNFSLYLRGNFSEIDNAKPIRFSQEMNHVKHYTDIEQVRFPDMTIQYDLRSVEFVLPALSVQPLVENAIKHGLMGLEEGGIVTISAYETDSHYVVEVKDDGVGFDSTMGYDEKKHVGIKNIRGRIEAMCGGTLLVESEIGKGTKATIKIPKGGGRK